MSEPESYELRALLPADLQVVRELWSVTEGVELCEGDRVEDLAHYLRRNPGASSVAVGTGGEILGAVLAGQDGRRGFLYHLAVRAEARGMGIGRALVDRSLAELRITGVSRALLLVDCGNETGRAFWTSRGWEPLEQAEPRGIDL